MGSGRVVIDNKGNVVKQYEPFFSQTSGYEDEDEVTKWGVSATLHYDPIGRNTRVDLPDGNVRRWRYSPWKVEAFDENDTLSGGDFENTPGVTHLDAQGRVYKSWAFLDASAYLAEYPDHPDHDATLSEDPEHADHADNLLKTSIELDIQGNPVSVTDPRGNIIQVQDFDILGRPAFTGAADEGYDPSLSMTANTKGQSWAFGGVDGQPVRMWRSGNLTTRHTYDALRRPVSRFADTGAGERLVEHQVYGELSGAGGATTNLLGKPFRAYDGAGMIEVAAYDFRGNPVTTKRVILDDPRSEPDWSGLENQTTLAALNSHSKHALLSSASVDAFAVEMAFDALNRPTEKRLPDVTAHGRSTITYGYDAGSRLRQVQLTPGSGGTTVYLVQEILYNARGQRLSIEYTHDTADTNTAKTKTTYTYAADRLWLTNLKTIKPADPTNPLQDLTYNRDAVGNILSITDGAQQTHYFGNAVATPDQSFSYDALYRLTSATGRENDSFIHTSSGYGTPHGLPFANIPTTGSSTDRPRRYEQRYSYDAGGNITEMKHLSHGVTQWTRSYSYAPDSNQLTQTVEPSASGGAGTPTHSYSYNARGAMTQMGHLHAISRDWRDQIGHVQVDSSGNKQAHYRYDGAGTRVTKVVETTGGDDVLVVYLGDFEVYREIDSSGVIQEERETVHVMDDTRRIVMVETKTTEAGATPMSIQPRFRFQFDNHIGSASMECDKDGNLISYEEFHPYGTTAWWAEDSSIQVSRKRYRYTGMEKDEETGLSYHNARYYMTWLGRWDKADPIGLKAGINRFSYVRASPIRLQDPSGTDEQTEAFVQGVWAGLVESGKEAIVGVPDAMRLIPSPLNVAGADLLESVTAPLSESMEAHSTQQLREAMSKDETSAQVGAGVGYFGAIVASVVVGPEGAVGAVDDAARAAGRVADEAAAAGRRVLDEVSAGIDELAARAGPEAVPAGGPRALPKRADPPHARSPEQQAKIDALNGRNGTRLEMSGPTKPPGSFKGAKPPNLPSNIGPSDDVPLFKGLTPEQADIAVTQGHGFRASEYPGDGSYFALYAKVASPYAGRGGGGVVVTVNRSVWDELVQAGQIIDDPNMVGGGAVIVRPEALEAFTKASKIEHAPHGSWELYDIFRRG
ncbi:MAG: RHS repeat-associated core domain-containing protein [Myxococcota bacterium]